MDPIVTYVLLVVIACILLICCIRGVGFSAVGVVAGSIAAIVQSIIGNVAAGSAFAIAQSIGATGNLPCFIILVVAAFVAYFMYLAGLWRWPW